jgi:methylglutaconyl-CoA hydratase
VNPHEQALTCLEIDGPIARLSMHRPESRNALSLDLIESIRARAAELKENSGVSVCVLTGVGKCFCAGMDLKAVLDEPGAPAKLLNGIANLTLELRDLPQVIVGRINGAAIGGGCGLACVCDFSITHDDAKLGFPEVDLGVCPAVVAPWLVHRIGAGRARQVLLTGGLMSGADAKALGMVTESVARNDLDAAVNELAGRLAGAGPSALAATRAWLNEIGSDELKAQVLRRAEIAASVIETPEARRSLERTFSKQK